MARLPGKRAIVTGAGSGIGRASATRASFFTAAKLIRVLYRLQYKAIELD